MNIPLPKKKRESYLRKAVNRSFTFEKCILKQYQTNNKQWVDLLENTTDVKIPIEWIIDIKDINGKWYFGTAYQYNDVNNSLHYAIPDMENPIYEGDIELDFRIVRLVECIDHTSIALYNQIFRDSIIKVYWELDWYNQDLHDNSNCIPAICRYYIQSSNTILIETEENLLNGSLTMIPLDLNVRFINCINKRGLDDFMRLIRNGDVLYAFDAEENAALGINESKLRSALRLSTINVKCVDQQYVTTEDHVKQFRRFMYTVTDPSKVSIEWIINIADASNTWFYATAYSYDDVNNSIYIMVPDKCNPSFEGYVSLDYRQVHLIDCCDIVTRPLFNKLIRDSVVKVDWEIDWLDEVLEENADGTSSIQSQWLASVARYYIRLTNLLLVDNEKSDSVTSEGVVMITVGPDIRLKRAAAKGRYDYDRLINEKIVDISSVPLEGDSADCGEYEPVIVYHNDVMCGKNSSPMHKRKMSDMSDDQMLSIEKDVDSRNYSHTFETIANNDNGISSDVQINEDTKDTNMVSSPKITSNIAKEVAAIVVRSVDQSLITHTTPSSLESVSLNQTNYKSFSLLQWLERCLGADTARENIEMCHNALLEECIESLDLLADIDTSEFTSDYLKRIGISKAGLRAKLTKAHRELISIKKGEVSGMELNVLASKSNGGNMESIDFSCCSPASSSNLNVEIEVVPPPIKTVALDSFVAPANPSNHPPIRDIEIKQENITTSILPAHLYAEKNLEVLRSQLQSRNIKPLEFIPLNSIKEEIQALSDAANNGLPYDDSRLDYLLACMEINEEYVIEKKNALTLWVEKLQGYITECVTIMRSYIPKDILSSSISTLEARGVNKSIASHIMTKKCLWLIRMHPAAIDKLHEADLISKYNTEAQNLDIVEMVAIYGSIPKKFTNDSRGKKKEWRDRMEDTMKIGRAHV